MGVFSWLRRMVRDAFIAGIEDGCQAVANGDADTGPVLLSFQARIAPALPAPEEETPKRKAK